MVVRCKVTEVPKKESKKQKLGLSLNPRDLNNSLASAGLRNGMVRTHEQKARPCMEVM